jgi:hypothetical protein
MPARERNSGQAEQEARAYRDPASASDVPAAQPAHWDRFQHGPHSHLGARARRGRQLHHAGESAPRGCAALRCAALHCMCARALTRAKLRPLARVCQA